MTTNNLPFVIESGHVRLLKNSILEQLQKNERNWVYFTSPVLGKIQKYCIILSTIELTCQEKEQCVGFITIEEIVIKMWNRKRKNRSENIKMCFIDSQEFYKIDGEFKILILK